MFAILALLLAAGTTTPLYPGPGNLTNTGFIGTCAGGANVVPTVPSEIANNDILLLWGCSQDNQTITATGYTSVLAGTGTNSSCNLLWKRTTGTESNPTVTRGTTTGEICASVTVWRGATTSGNPWDAVSASMQSSSTTPLTVTGITSTADDGATIAFYGSGITANATPTFPTAGGSATRGLGLLTAARITQGGATTNRAVIGGAWDVQPAHGATGNATVTFVNATTGVRLGMLIHLQPATGTNPKIWNPIKPAANGHDVNGIDTSTQQLGVQDQSPLGSGDIMRVYRTYNSGGAETWYVSISQDGGDTWNELTASSGVAPSTTLTPTYQSLCQDTVNYKLHMMTWDTSGSPKYHRIALTYTSNHVSGWTWDAADVAGPSFDASGDATELAGHVNLREVIDGSSNHILVLAALDQPVVNNILVRLVISRTTSLAPTTGTDWKKLTSGSTAGFDVVMRKFCSTGSDGGTLPRDVFGRPAAATGTTCTLNQSPSEEQHDSDVAFAQAQTSGDLAFFLGEMFYNDTATGPLLSHIEMFRFTVSGTDWALDAGNNGTSIAVSTSSTAAQPCIGNAVGSKNYIWFTWGNGDGLHVGRLNSSGTWTTNAVPQPDTSVGNNTGQVWWYSQINVRADEQTLYIAYMRADLSPSASHYFDGYFDSSWHLTDFSVQLAVPDIAAQASLWQVAMWSGVYGMSNGIGVITYGDLDWALSHSATHHWFTAIYAGPLPPLGPQVDTTACAGTSVAHCPQITGTTATSITTAGFATVNARELVCALISQQGVGSTSTAISSSGLTFSTAFTKIGSCSQGTTTDVEIYCGVTSAIAVGATVTAIFTATSVASSNMTVVPYSSSATTLPTNYVCAHNTSGAATLSITNVGANSQVLESGADSSGTGTRTATSNATIDPVGQAGATGFAWDEFSGPLSGTNTVGTTAPTSTAWALDAIEVLAASGTTVVPQFMLMGVGP